MNEQLKCLQYRSSINQQQYCISNNFVHPRLFDITAAEELSSINQQQYKHTKIA